MLERLSDTRRRQVLSGLTVTLLGRIGIETATAAETERASTDRRARTRASRQSKRGGNAIEVPEDYETIQAALDAADPDDTVEVADGTYDESLEVATEGVTLRAAKQAAPTIDARGAGTGVKLTASGVTVRGFEIRGDQGTSSGISIVTSAGATEDITIRDNHIHGMRKAGGGGLFEISSWGILSYGNQPLSGVRIEDNHIEEIGSQDVGDAGFGRNLLDPIGVGIDLEEVHGDRQREGAVVRKNTVENIRNGRVATVTLPGVGVAVQPLDGESSGAGAAATDVSDNEIRETAFDVLLGDAALTRVFNNNRPEKGENEDGGKEDGEKGDDGKGKGKGDEKGQGQGGKNDESE